MAGVRYLTKVTKVGQPFLPMVDSHFLKINSRLSRCCTAREFSTGLCHQVRPAKLKASKSTFLV